MLYQMKFNKEMIIKLLEKILRVQIKDIEFNGTEHYNSIIEYEFSLFKIKITYKNNEKVDIYMKMIKGGKIKESIFCYWSLLYEEYLKYNKNEDNILKKAIITQTTTNDNSSTLVLTLDPKLNYSAEINLVELRKFLDENKKYERWLDNLEIKNDDILFIGKKRY